KPLPESGPRLGGASRTGWIDSAAAGSLHDRRQRPGRDIRADGSDEGVGAEPQDRHGTRLRALDSAGRAWAGEHRAHRVPAFAVGPSRCGVLADIHLPYGPLTASLMLCSYKGPIAP